MQTPFHAIPILSVSAPSDTYATIVIFGQPSTASAEIANVQIWLQAYT